MDESAARTTVDWQPWGREPFDAAAAAGQPLLLAVTGFWCGWCRAMDARTYADPRIGARINDAVVPVRVDADRHPVVRARYTLGGLPATVFLAPDGRLLASAGYLDPEDFRDVLDRVLDSWTESDGAGGQVPEPLQETALPGGSISPAIEAQLVGQLDAGFDEEHAGWGTDAKFPLPAAIEFALTRRPAQAEQTLAAIREGLEDPGDGGFFRHARARDWSEPMLEKLLSVNAAMLRAQAQAYLTTGESVHRQGAERTVRFLVETLWADDGFANSQAPGEYFSQPPDERRPEDRPAIDAARYAETNADAVEALLRHVAYTDDELAREYAERGLGWLLGERVAEGRVRRSEDASGPLTIWDQGAVLDALTTACQVLGTRYLEPAREVAEETISALRFPEGAFVDGTADGPALLDRPLYPIDANARLADALVDLAALTESDPYREAARAALDAYADAADHLGVQAARYGLATARLPDETLVIDVATGPGSDLHRAALRMADPEKVVVPGADLAAPGRARIRGVDPLERPIQSPEDLAAAVKSAR